MLLSISIHPETSGFLMFSGGIERNQGVKWIRETLQSDSHSS